jgi:acetyltransferase
MFSAMSAIHLDKIFYPKSIAVIGDDSSEGRIFSTLVHNLIEGGYPGSVYPIHPSYQRILKQPVYPSLLKLNSQVDLGRPCRVCEFSISCYQRMY